jgi:hypothetical protein
MAAIRPNATEVALVPPLSADGTAEIRLVKKTGAI